MGRHTPCNLSSLYWGKLPRPLAAANQQEGNWGSRQTQCTKAGRALITGFDNAVSGMRMRAKAR